MAQYNITHTCGHTQTVNLYGKSTDRQRKIDWLKTTRCRACANAVETAEATVASVNLPELDGSEKQIAWALKIRLQQRKKLDTFVADMIRKAERTGQDPALVTAQTDPLVADIMAQTWAGWWIDHRDDSALGLLKVVAK